MVGDPETREPGGEGTIMYYRGPYGYPHMPHLLDDLVRLNLFRHVEIHCVGIGEADMGFLSQIARIGLGGKTHDLRM